MSMLRAVLRRYAPLLVAGALIVGPLMTLHAHAEQTGAEAGAASGGGSGAAEPQSAGPAGALQLVGRVLGAGSTQPGPAGPAGEEAPGPSAAVADDEGSQPAPTPPPSAVVAVPMQVPGLPDLPGFGSEPDPTPTPSPTPTPPPTPTPTPPPANTVGPAHVNPPWVVQGGHVDVAGEGYSPGAVVDASLHSSPQFLGSAHADSFGRVSMRVHIPHGVAVGNHEIRLAGPNPRGGVHTNIGVISVTPAVAVLAAAAAPAPAPAPVASRTLPLTGGTMAVVYAAFGLASLGELTVAGSLVARLLLADRRRRRR